METFPDDLLRMLEWRKELAVLGADIRIKELEKVRALLQAGVQENFYCYAQTGFSAAVDPRGNIYPCASFVGMPDMRIGSIAEGFQMCIRDRLIANEHIPAIVVDTENDFISFHLAERISEAMKASYFKVNELKKMCIRDRRRPMIGHV